MLKNHKTPFYHILYKYIYIFYIFFHKKMLGYDEMVIFRQEIEKVFKEFMENENGLELNTLWSEIKNDKIHVWREKIKYCTLTAFFLESKLETMVQKIESFSL